ncbi:hypothetical protein ACOL3H_07125 [Aliarcobacter butzleri]
MNLNIKELFNTLLKIALFIFSPIVFYWFAKLFFFGLIESGVPKSIQSILWFICLYFAVKFYIEFIKLVNSNPNSEMAVFFIFLGLVFGASIGYSIVFLIEFIFNIEISIIDFYFNFFN